VENNETKVAFLEAAKSSNSKRVLGLDIVTPEKFGEYFDFSALNNACGDRKN
jgi:hypothetical protein